MIIDMPEQKLVEEFYKMEQLPQKNIDSAIIKIVENKLGTPYRESLLRGIHDLETLEKEILQEITKCNVSDDDKVIERIFHRIQIWGGRTGRYFYVKETNGDFSQIKETYKKLINACINISGLTIEDCNGLAKAAIEYKIPNIGVSFITKHIRFWTYRKLGENAYPIYDSIMAKNYYGKKATFTNLPKYWWKMINDPKRYNSLMKYERQLFNSYHSL